MKYCTYCGTQLKDEAAFCWKCGKKTVDQKSIPTTNTRSEASKSRAVPANKQNVDVIKNYLYHASEMEWHNYQIKSILNELTSKRDACLTTIDDLKLKLDYEHKTIKNSQNNIENYKKIGRRKNSFYFGYDIDSENYSIWLFATYIIFAIVAIFNIGPAPLLLDKLMNFLSSTQHPILVAIIGIPLFPLVLLFIWQTIVNIIDYIFYCINEEKKENEHNRTEEEKYQNSVKNNNSLIAKSKENIKKYEAQIKTEENVVLPGLKAEIKKTEDALNKSNKALDQYYDANVIYQKYRGLIPVCTMYEYFDSGRTTTLTGHEGAYNLYESELKYHKISNQLDVISTKLDNISASQEAIFHRLGSIGVNINNLMKSVDRVSEENVRNSKALNASIAQLQSSTELTNYYSRSANETLKHLEYAQTARNYTII